MSAHPRSARILALAALALVSGCPTGPGVEGFTPATSPRGVYTTLELRGGRFTGELLTIDDSSFVLTDGCVVYVAPFRVVRRAKFEGIATLHESGEPSGRTRERVRLSSRFPNGIPPRAMPELLKCSGMSAPRALPAPRDGTTRGDAAEGAAEGFLAAAKDATSRFQALDSAIAAGYRRIGGDLPALGEHWVHPGLVMSGSLEARRPAILIYVRDSAAPRLAGAAWTALLRPGEEYPPFPAGRGAWHEHNGAVAEETLPLHHVAGPSGDVRTRVAVLHAWLWQENPAGVWTAENWALPFVRAGLVPSGDARRAAQGLSLTAPGAMEYYERVIAATAHADAPAPAWARATLTDAAARADAIRRGASRRLSGVELTRLAGIWDGLWERLANGPPAR